MQEVIRFHGRLDGTRASKRESGRASVGPRRPVALNRVWPWLQESGRAPLYRYGGRRSRQRDVQELLRDVGMRDPCALALCERG